MAVHRTVSRDRPGKFQSKIRTTCYEESKFSIPVFVFITRSMIVKLLHNADEKNNIFYKKNRNKMNPADLLNTEVLNYEQFINCSS